ncbi:MAG: translation initiation factor IF-2 [Gammaproteobacteria bacterium]|nr:translation initiation factor IF-2 [Gammaproteobacteria bacterium]
MAGEIKDKEKVDHNGSPKRLVLRRKTVSRLQVSDAKGRGKKTINVEVRKRRTYVQQPGEAEQHTEKAAAVEIKKIKVVEPEPVVKQQSAKQDKPAAVAQGQSRNDDAKEKAAQAVNEQVVSEQEKAVSKDKPLPAAMATPEPTVQPEKGKKSKAKHPAQEDEKGKSRKSKKAKQRQEKRRRQMLLTDDEDEQRIARGGRRRSRTADVKSVTKQEFEMPVTPQIKEVAIPETISVAELSKKLSLKSAQVIRKLIDMGVMATINQMIDRDTATLLVEELGHKAVELRDDEVEMALNEELSYQGREVTRPPVVTIMGHVDHGKTTLLDHIRCTKVAAGEAGGITQGIGAYHVETERGVVTFLDTPGHEAFTAMRARGAKFTDIVVLVVAADDGVMPQTIEAIQHAKAGEVPIVVAVNKIDKEDADPERIRSELGKYELIPEEWGGDVMFVNVSAKQGQGIDNLLEAILLQAEIMELKAMEEIPAKGVVIEAKLDKGRGVVTTILVQQGTLKSGNIILAGQEYGRIRALFDETGKPLQQAGPSIPVEMLGLSGMPNAGDIAVVVQEERKALEVALFRQGKYREIKLARKVPSLDNLFSDIKQGQVATLNVILKADVQGSIEALDESLQKLATDELQVKVIASGVGGITESDANLALASAAVIIGFNVRADLKARQLIDREKIDVHYHSIIYNVIDEVKQALSGMLAPKVEEKILGIAEVREVFRAGGKQGSIAGCMVIDGYIKRGKAIRILRDSVVVYEGELESLRRHKDDASEVRNNTECGIGIKNYNDIKVGDHIEVFELVSLKRKL